MVGQVVPATRRWERETNVYSQLQETYDVHTQRTLSQDVTFAINQLVEVAVRALSPSLNDPFTAMQCLDWLGEALARLANRKIPSPYRSDKDGTLRIIAHPIPFASLTDTAFNMIRMNSAGSASVMFRMMETIRHVLAHARRAEDRAVLLEHASMVHQQALAALHAEPDRRAVEECYRSVIQVNLDGRNCDA